MNTTKNVKKTQIGKDILNYLMSNNRYHFMRIGNKAVGYRRTSKKIRTSENNLEDQENFIRKKAKQQNLKLVKVYNEGIKRGANAHRPLYIKMLEDLKNDKSITTVIVSSLDRLTREGDEIALILHKMGINLISARENTDMLTTDTLSLTRKLLLEAKIEHIKKSASTNMARRRMLKEGIKSATPPYGYKFSTSKFPYKGRVIFNKKLVHKVRRSFELFAMGYSVTEIMKKLRYTKNDIKKRQFRNMIKDPFYIGIIDDKSSPILITGSHKPLISIQTFRKCLQNLGLL